MYKLRTIDVWDTLLRRDCHPECIKLATAMHLFLGWFDHLKPEFNNCWALYRARINAERGLAEAGRSQGKDDEYEITLVLRHWVDNVFSSPAAIHLASELAEFELNTEIARTFADPEIAEILRPHLAEKTLFLSDFYMSTTMLGRLARLHESLAPLPCISCRRQRLRNGWSGRDCSRPENRYSNASVASVPRLPSAPAMECQRSKPLLSGSVPRPQR